MAVSLRKSLGRNHSLIIDATVELMGFKVGSQRHSLNVLGLEVVDPPLDLDFVFSHDLLLELESDVVVLLVHHVLPGKSANKVAAAGGRSSIDVLRSLEESHSIQANHGIVLEPQGELGVKVDAVANVEGPIHEEVGEVTLFQFPVQNFISFQLDRLKFLQNANDKVSVDLVIPREEAVLIDIVHVGDFEGSSKLLQERCI